MGRNNSQPEKEQTSNKKPQSKDKKGKGNDQALAALKLGSGSLGTLSSPQSKMKAKERKKIEKIMEEFKSTYPELQTDQDFNPLTMDLAISQGLHIDFVRETAKIQLQFTPILKKSSLLEVKLLYLKKEFWRNSYEVWSHINNQQLMIVNSSGDEYRVNSLPATCGYSEFVLKVDKKSSGRPTSSVRTDPENHQAHPLSVAGKWRPCGGPFLRHFPLLQQPNLHLLLLGLLQAEIGEAGNRG